MNMVLIPVGIAYEQVMADFRAMLRSELNSASPAPSTAQPSLDDELLSIREAAAILGVTVQTVHEHKRLGRLRYHKLGSRSYIKRSDILAALQGHQRSEKQGKGTTARKGSQRPAVA